MKSKRIELLPLALFLLPLCMVLLGAGCEKEEYSELVEGYIVGSFVCYEVGTDGVATGDYTERGYCILLEGSEKTDSYWPMDFYTFDLSSELFEFPEKVIYSSVDYNGNDCGPSFFPDSLQSKFKITFEYRDVKKDEGVRFSCGICTTMGPLFNWKDYNQVLLKNVSKIVN
ncbi:hypothetical protein [Mariniphaga sediminis]|jgi:hypothetical protein|uniref:hypothetical protein n=1 Tax=Mariniphaga sediminis TaxID=1628158 RepID=UPI003567FF10